MRGSRRRRSNLEAAVNEPGNLMPLSAEAVKPDPIQPNEPIITTGSPRVQVAVLSAVREASEPSRVYWVMNALAMVIACYGLFANSPAVVIGAMVVARCCWAHSRAWHSG
jgi:hypothetical protein